MKKQILSDGSVVGETFSGPSYTGKIPTPNYGKETYRQYYKRVEECKKKGFHLGDLSWSDWDTYCAGSPYHDAYIQDDIIQ